MKLILYGAVVSLVLLLILFVWLDERRRKCRKHPDVITPLLPNSQATLIGWRGEDGSFVGARLIQRSESPQQETSVVFDPPLILKPGETFDVHFWTPEGLTPVGNKWRAYPYKSFKT